MVLYANILSGLASPAAADCASQDIVGFHILLETGEAAHMITW